MLFLCHLKANLKKLNIALSFEIAYSAISSVMKIPLCFQPVEVKLKQHCVNHIEVSFFGLAYGSLAEARALAVMQLLCTALT